MSKRLRQALRERKAKLRRRRRRQARIQGSGPVLGASNIHYEMSRRVGAISHGGLGAIHLLQQRLGLAAAIDSRVCVLKQHRPYLESDHVLSIVYNLICGGTCLEDLERRRQDVDFMRALGAQRLPDPTTGGDFLRRFGKDSVEDLQDAINSVRKGVWAMQSREFCSEAIVNVDGTMAPTSGQCKQGTDFSYKGEFGYHPLVVSLHQTREPLFLCNRPGNRPSHEGSAEYIDRALDLLEGTFEKVTIRGDTDFALTRHFDKWDERCTFVFGLDAFRGLVAYVEECLGEEDWHKLERPPRYEVKTTLRRRPANIKQEMIRQHEKRNIRLNWEDVAEFDYQPTRCKKPYRVIALRKNLTVEKGELVLFDEIRYFFYITNDETLTKEEIVYFANDRCDHENDIEQLKNGVHAMKNPGKDLTSNWAYMVIASLAWSLKAWFALVSPKKETRRRLVRMEFKTFCNWFMNLPCQIVHQGRRIIYRLLGYHDEVPALLETFRAIQRL